MFCSRRTSLSRLAAALSLAVAALGVDGCSQRAAAPPTAPISAALAAESAPNVDAGHGTGYAFHIQYPELSPQWSVLALSLREFATAQKNAYLAARAADKRSNGPDYAFDLKFDVARRTADFVSVLTDGSIFLGGAHGMPIVASFNFHLADDKIVALADLFSDPDTALQALSTECRRQLLGRYDARLRQEIGDAKTLAAQLASMRDEVERGTQPTLANFNVFLVDGLDSPAIGLTLIFPPYQVRPYVDGTQQVEVPAKVFYALLKPEYRSAFAIDTEAEKISGGVR